MRAPWDQTRDDIKGSLSMDEVLRLCGLPQPQNGKIRSVTNPNDRTPSLHIYKDNWYDYSTGQGGDQIAFVQMALGLNYLDALQFLGRGVPMTQAARTRYQNDMPYEVRDFTSKFEDEPEAYSGDRVEEQWASLVAEKWPTLELIDLYLFGCKITELGELWIPHWVPDDGKLYVRGIKIRYLPDGAKAAVKGSNFTVGLYRPTPYVPTKDHALVVEGESDAWVMAKMLEARNVTVYALPSGAATRKDRFIEELESHSTVGVAFDDDEPGQAAAEWLMTSERLNNAYPIEVPGGRVAEAAAAGWQL